MKERPSFPSPQEAIRRHVEDADDWEWHDIASELYVWTDRFSDRFFNRQMPETVLSFERMDHRILAAYTLRRNPQGLLYEITFNVKHLDRDLWETLETLMHEYMHLWQQNFGQNPVTRNYHNEEFVQACEGLGLHPEIGSGVHARPADGLFAEFLRAYGVREPVGFPDIKISPSGKPLDWWADPDAKPRGQSNLHKWTCGCQNVRVGTKEFHAQCLRCGNLFHRVDASEAGREPLPKNADPRKSSEHDSGWTQTAFSWSADDIGIDLELESKSRGISATPEAHPVENWPLTDQESVV